MPFVRTLINVYTFLAGESIEELNGYGTMKPRNFISSILGRTPGKSKSHPWISNPHDLRQVTLTPLPNMPPRNLTNRCRYTHANRDNADGALAFTRNHRRQLPTTKPQTFSFLFPVFPLCVCAHIYCIVIGQHFKERHVCSVHLYREFRRSFSQVDIF